MMKCIHVNETGGPEVLQLVSKPQPTIEPGHVIVKNAFVGINFIDIYHRTGLYPLPLPFIPGREGAGIIVETSPEVTRFQVGDQVAWIGPSGYAEYTKVPISHVVPLPSGMTLEQGAASMIQGLTALTLITQAYSVKKGDWVLVHAGAGGTGQWLIQLLKILGAKVITTVGNEMKAQKVMDLGVDHVFCYALNDLQNLSKTILDWTQGKGVQVVYDGVGAATFEASLSSLAKQGYLISFGNASGKVPLFDISRLSKGNVYLARPTLFEYLDNEESMQHYASMLFSMMEKHQLHPQIHKIYTLNQIQEAHKELESRKSTGKILLQI
ncbi:NADPH:quinone reductase [Coelomomyces lativittatus]|nr:NADPH:quinone reductase [Coelomomyces lativittatus]KAJ1507905.1 NADPH:quinone reductase [Coelomomyces lativittatus]